MKVNAASTATAAFQGFAGVKAALECISADSITAAEAQLWMASSNPAASDSSSPAKNSGRAPACEYRPRPRRHGPLLPPGRHQDSTMRVNLPGRSELRATAAVAHRQTAVYRNTEPPDCSAIREDLRYERR